MKIIEKNIEYMDFNLKSFNTIFQGMNFAVFDIETTGLSSSYASIMLSGMILVRNGKADFIQLLAERPQDEEKLLIETFKRLASVDYVVTFNGHRFDIPFIIERKEKLLPNEDLPELPYNLDLYRIVNSYSDLRSMLPDLRQKTVERFMGLNHCRMDKISGEDSVKMYREYLKNGDKELERQILLHNSDDIELLYALIPVIHYCDFHRALCFTGFPVKDMGIIYQIKLTKKQLTIKGNLANPFSYENFPVLGSNYYLNCNGKTGDFTMDIPVEPLNNYVICDLMAIDKNFKTEGIPDVTSGYMILSKDSIPSYSSICMLGSSILCYICGLK